MAALLAAVLGLACLPLSGCGGAQEEVITTPQPFYNHSGFTRNGQFYYYIKNNTVARQTGVDVSDHQGWIDWEAVHGSGVQFAFIRIGYRGATEGDLYQDEFYEYNINATRAAGMQRGVYFFSQAINVEEAKEEAAFVLQLLGDTTLEYPVVFDYEMKASGIESRVENVSTAEATEIARAFCDTIEAAGYDAMLYGNGHDLGHYDLAALEDIPRWYAEYGELPGFTEEYVIWQYSNVGEVNGIDTVVDLNVDLSAILALQQEEAPE